MNIEELIQPDIRSKKLNYTPENMQKDFENVKINANVPLHLQTQFNVTKSLCYHGYFNYEFFGVAHNHITLMIESAFIIRFNQFYNNKIPIILKNEEEIKIIEYNKLYELKGKWKLKDDKEFKLGYKNLIKWAERKGFIELDEDKKTRLFIGAIELRKNSAHKTYQIITMYQDVLIILTFASEIINELFSNNQRVNK